MREVNCVKKKSNSSLYDRLLEEPDLDAYLEANRSLFSTQTCTGLLAELYKKHPACKAALARRSGMSSVYLHQALAGRRKLSRDRLLCLCVGLDATLDETQELLKTAIYAPLCPEFKRDAIVAHGIVHHTDLTVINDKLAAENEKPLCPKKPLKIKAAPGTPS